MLPARTFVCTLAVVLLLPASAWAAGCEASGGERPIASLSQVPESLRSLKTPRGVSNDLAAGNRGPSAADDSLWPTLDVMCGDWIVICKDSNCDHGVAECDGECIPF
jgi:hypothetical protein